MHPGPFPGLQTGQQLGKEGRARLEHRTKLYGTRRIDELDAPIAVEEARRLVVSSARPARTHGRPRPEHLRLIHQSLGERLPGTPLDRSLCQGMVIKGWSSRDGNQGMVIKGWSDDRREIVLRSSLVIKGTRWSHQGRL